MDAPSSEHDREPPPLTREDSLVYARACLPADTPDEKLPAYAALVRHVLADIRDLP